MDRPTCATCPFWELMGGDTAYLVEVGWADEDDEEIGRCHRFPPTRHINVAPEGEPSAIISECPMVLGDDWCGEHPDFHAHLASRKRPAANEAARARAIEALSPRERELIKLRYGPTEGGQAYSLREVARILKVTLERARQIEEKAIDRLAARGVTFD